MPHLAHPSFIELFKLASEILGSDYEGQRRRNCFAGIPDAFLAQLVVADAPRDQLLADLHAMNEVLSPIDGVVPLAAWLGTVGVVHGQHPHAAELADFLIQIGPMNGAPAGDSDAIFQACCNHLYQPLLDRRELRARLRELVAGDFRVLSILGEPASGKSYSLEFIHHVARSRGFQVHTVDVRSEALDAFGPADLAMSLVELLGVDGTTLPEQNSQLARFVKELRNWIVAQFRDHRDGKWIVLDHFDDETVEETTRLLITQLAKRAGEGTLPPLILLGYERPREPESLERSVPREEIGLIERIHVERHYRSFLSAADQEPPEDAVKEAVTAVYGVAGENPDLEALSRAVEKVDRALSREG